MTKHVTLAEFQAHAADLLTEVQETGETVVIEQEGRPPLELTRQGGEPTPTAEERLRRLDALRGSITVCGDIMAPVVDDDDWELD